MLLGISVQLENDLVLLLSEHGKCSIQSLRKLLSEKGRSASIQGIYRVIRKLVKEGVVIKEGQVYGLSLSWVVELGRVVERMQNTYVNYRYIRTFLPSRSINKRTWRFNNLMQLNAFWNHVLLALILDNPQQKFLHVVPHVWFRLVQPKQEQQYEKIMLSRAKRGYAICENNTYLDRWCSQAWDTKKFEFFFMAPQKNPRNVYVSVLGDIIVTVRLGARADSFIDELFQTSTSSHSLKQSSLAELLTMPVQAKLVVEEDEHKASTVRSRFIRVFGPL